MIVTQVYAPQIKEMPRIPQALAEEWLSNACDDQVATLEKLLAELV